MLKYPLALCMLLLACSGPSESENKETNSPTPVLRGPKATLPLELHSLYDSVMVIHDDQAMPLYGPAMSLRIELRGQYDSLRPMPAEDSARLEALVAAGDRMMEWMRTFEVDYTGWPTDSARQYLEGELESIQNIYQQLDRSMKAAQGQPEGREE